jgi:hypothetical protein
MFARDDDGVTNTDDPRPDWPFGPFLKQAIDASGMSQRRVATAARISEGRLRQLITGYQKSGDMRIPISTTTTTVHALASVLDFDIYEGLTLAGLEASIPSAQRRAEMDEGLQESDLPQDEPGPGGIRHRGAFARDRCSVRTPRVPVDEVGLSGAVG